MMDDEYCPKHDTWFGREPCPRCRGERDQDRLTVHAAYDAYIESGGGLELDQWCARASYFADKLVKIDRERNELEMSHRRLFEDYERLQAAAENLANTVVAYFNKRGAAHSDRKGNEDIAAMADALSDYGYRTASMFTRRQEWTAQRLDDAARVTEEP